MTSLSLQQAEGILDAGLDRARELGLKPLTIAVLDAGGHLVAFKRQDRSGILRPDIAQGKAWGALGMGLGGIVKSMPCLAITRSNWKMQCSSTSIGAKRTGDRLRLRQRLLNRLPRPLDLSG
jgi:uncharacterized protein GlcG (DUF336 family)